jgi:cation diffusion facilitator CzcD-associated flavoprotein CzcO
MILTSFIRINAFFFVMCLDHPAQPFYEGICKERMHSSMVNDPELEKRIVPQFKPGCRRITPGDGYLEALQQPNCEDCWDPIERITEEGIQTAKGVEKFDLIVCATGFDSSGLPQWKLVGRDGATLEELWKDDPEAFYASMVSRMPNYAMINGPNAAISHGSVIQQMSWTADFILKWVKYMSRHHIK